MKDNLGDKKLTNTENGRKTLVQYSKVLNDGLLSGIEDEAQIKYHLTPATLSEFFLMLHILM